MEVKDVPQVAAYLDIVVLTGCTEDAHLHNLETVLRRLDEAGLRLKRSKCSFMQAKLNCMGQQIDKDGIRPVKAKVDAIKCVPSPNSTTEIRYFLGMLNFYSKHLPNASTVLAPLHKLLCKNILWKWGPAEELAFNKAKDLLVSDSLLVHFHPAKQLLVSCDASPYGVGAVLAHKMQDGSERPISYASRTLSAAEKNYSQLENEALAMVFAVKKIHMFLHRHNFTLVTDHKPLLGLFGHVCTIPMMASARLQRWILAMENYEYDLIFRS